MKLQRHDLVWLKSVSPMSDGLKAWLEQDLPCVVTRQNVGSDKLRIAWCQPRVETIAPLRQSELVEFELVLQHANPLCLLELNKIISLPEAALLLIQQLELHGITSRVYGSYAWQILTGKSYIHQDSDIDILIAVNSIAQLDYALIFFQQLEPLLKIKIDGELIFYHSQAVAWREWLQASEIVLVKSLTSVNLAPRAELLAGLPPC